MSKRTPGPAVMASCVIAAAITGCGSSASPDRSQTSSVSVTATSPTPTPTPTPTTPSATPSEQPTDAVSASSAPYVSTSPVETTLTAKNNKDLAAVLKLPDYCDEKIAAFASTYAGQSIEFDGSIVVMDHHGDYKTRYDILIAPGNKGPNSTIGPAFKFDDVNVFDLNLTGANVPDSVGVGDRLHVVATVGEFNPAQCLFFLEPVSTQVR
jgi:hypothetical protein